jgi:hypothetical protein
VKLYLHSPIRLHDYLVKHRDSFIFFTPRLVCSSVDGCAVRDGLPMGPQPLLRVEGSAVDQLRVGSITLQHSTGGGGGESEHRYVHIPNCH